MTSRIALALGLLLSLGGPNLASGPSEPDAEAAKGAAPADESANPAAPSSEDQATDDMPGESESDDQQQAPIDVHRHRPGACPEGPPCKAEE
jgi:hypothetical protein